MVTNNTASSICSNANRSKLLLVGDVVGVGKRGEDITALSLGVCSQKVRVCLVPSHSLACSYASLYLFPSSCFLCCSWRTQVKFRIPAVVTALREIPSCGWETHKVEVPMCAAIRSSRCSLEVNTFLFSVRVCSHCLRL